jgi:pimeloyl-ACP methyl ester carboxylesterase
VTTQAILLPGAVMPADLAYDALLRALGDDVHAVAKDLEIYAAADPPPGYTLQHEIDGVLRTADAAGFDRFHLVGYSAGGAASVAFAAEHPERLLSLALLEPAWIGNDELSAEERAIWHRFEGVASLPPEQMMPAFVATQLAAGVQPPPPPPGPPPPWMAGRPAGVRKILETFRASSLDLDRLGAFDKPVVFALGGKSSPDYYAQMANRAAAIFCDFTLEVFAERHHFDPPHRIEPERTAAALRALWKRASA